MKEFRKTEEGLFICEECGQSFKGANKLSSHIGKYHDKFTYFKKWLKDEGDGICKICKNSTNFVNLFYGYKKCCCKLCENRMRKESIKIIREKYKNDILIKTKQTCLERYGVDNPSKNKEIKIKKQKTSLINNGVKAGFNNIEKCKKTWIKKYGVENPAQNLDILNKSYKTRFLIHNYKDTDLTYQGSYELDFLNNFYNKIKTIKNGPSIKYKFNEKNKIYHPDFYIPDLNLIIEIKSSWTLNLDVEYAEKKKATAGSGFDYIMILDKDYTKFIEYTLKEI